MQKLGEILREARAAKHISQEEVASRLLLKKETIQALEEGDWGALPQAAYVRGFIKNYADLLGLDWHRLLALHRAEYDERKYLERPAKHKRRLMFTPNLIAPIAAALGVIIFLAYLTLQYTSILSAPKVEIYSPQNDITTTAAVIEVSGKTEEDTTISIDGQLVKVDSAGNFNYQIKLADGRNEIEIIGSKRLSPKTKITRIVRLSR
ncbi:helix-turn-helix domain-containing protein [Candidatus Curtissbacteria bacterium]|nr:helix-turn-helix domain-containing protein [Candidatus Curtissbacteria bacterium]